MKNFSKSVGKDAPERKYFDTQTAGGVEFSTTGTVLLLNGVAQGIIFFFKNTHSHL